MGSTNTYGYTYDAAGQRTQEASTVGTRDFAYDNQRQLTSAYRVDSSGQPLANYNYSFNYDPIGNWQSETANGATTTLTANALNQYTSITNPKLAAAQNPSYDLNGNMTSDGQGNSFVYDEENRLIEADTPGTASLAKVVSVYDGLSRRVEKRTYDASGNLLSTTRYLYDGLLPIAECDANNVIQRTYTRGLDLSGTMQGAGGIGGLLALTDGTGSYSYFCDGNGNVVDLTNAYGVNVSHHEYDPFGNVIASTGTLSQPYQWSSKENDGNGLVYYLYRFYNPSLGRWVNRDRIGEMGGLNVYELTINNPIIYNDINGLEYNYIENRIPFDDLQNQPINIEGDTANSRNQPIGGFTHADITYSSHEDEIIADYWWIIQCFYNCKCAHIGDVILINLTVTTTLPTDIVSKGIVYSTGYDQIVGHEGRRALAYKKGYDAYLGKYDMDHNTQKGVTVCKKSSGLAQSELKDYLSKYRAKALSLFDKYEEIEQAKIFAEAKGEHYDKNGILVDLAPIPAVIDDPPSLDAPSFPKSDCP